SRLSSFRWTLPFSVRYCGRIGSRRVAGAPGSGTSLTDVGACIELIDMGYQSDAMRPIPNGRLAWPDESSAGLPRIPRVNRSNCTAMSDLPVNATGTPELSAWATVL